MATETDPTETSQQHAEWQAPDTNPDLTRDHVKSRIEYEKDAPKFPTVEGTDTPMTVSLFDSQTGERSQEKATLSEKEALQNLELLLAQVREVAQQTVDAQLADKVEAFRENLAYIGEAQLQEAVHGLAEKWRQLAELGKKLFVYLGDLRSERYIGLRILEEFNKLTAENPALRQRVKLSETGREILDQVSMATDKKKVKILIPDDFSLSGTQMKGHATAIFNGLRDRGLTGAEAAELIQINLVATPDRKDQSNQLTVPQLDGQGKTQETYPIAVHSYYGVKEYHGKDEKWVVYPGVSMTGTHSSSDYGYEMEIENFVKVLRRNHRTFPQPLPYYIDRPYELIQERSFSTSRSTPYQDPILQARWQKIRAQYSFSKNI